MNIKLLILWISELEEPTVEELPSSQQQQTPQSSESTAPESTSSSESSKSTCAHHPVLTNVTLTGGIKSGKFVSHGHVKNMDDCIQYCCDRGDECDLAFLVKNTCFSLHCKDDALCRSKPAKPSPYHPMVAYMTRYKPKLPRK